MVAETISVKIQTGKLSHWAMIESQGPLTLNNFLKKQDKISQRKEIIEIKVEGYEIENKLIIEKINDLRLLKLVNL